MKIKVDEDDKKRIIEKYPTMIGPIDKEITQKIKYYSKFKDQETLEKFGWEGKHKREYIPFIADFVMLINEDYVEYEAITNKDKEEIIKKLKDSYFDIIKILKKYCDIEESYYGIIALWIIGTYVHSDFKTYPYLFFNAMKGSGKTRILELIATLSKNGRMLNSLTETVLFRTSGTLCIDEFEGIGKKGNENLRELLNSAYKKGSKVIRFRKMSNRGEEKQVLEEFDVFRPIVMANIWGMENVLADRCITIILEKSNNPKITKKVQLFDEEKKLHQNFAFLDALCSLCSFIPILKVYKDWNIICNNTTYNTYNTYNTYTTQTTLNNNINHLFKVIKNSDEFNGRDLEISLPLLIIASIIDKNILDSTIESLKKIIIERKQEDILENRDVSLIDFLSQENDEGFFISVNRLNDKFCEFLQIRSEDINPRWMGRALKRLNLIIEKRRVGRGVEVKINYKKAREKIRMFK